VANLVKKRVQEIVAERISPLLELDRGSVEVVKIFKNAGKIQIRMGGSYRGSPCTDTLIKYVIEPILKDEFQEVLAVELVD
jgi:Fe-S cluster biogenesis protein NfuA